MAKLKKQSSVFYLVLEVLHINLPGGCDADRTYEHASHVCGCGVGAVRRHRDEADVPLHVTAELMVTLDGAKPGVLALGSTANRNN